MKKTWFWQVLPILCLLVFTLSTAGCGGGGSDSNGDTNDEQQQSEIPVVVGNINAPPAPGDFPVEQPIEAAFTDAPLGTNTAYDVQPIGAVTETRLVSKAVSELDPGVNYELNWVAVCENDGTPDPTLTSQSFNEGTVINLWVEYEARAGAEFSRTWSLDDASLILEEQNVTVEQDGVYRAMLPYILPYDSAAPEVVFTLVLSFPKESSAVVIEPGGIFRDISIEVVDVPTLPPIEYPQPLPDEPENDPDCMPEWINVTFSEDQTSVYVEAEKDLSNVVLKFSDYTVEKHDDLNQGTTGTFSGTGDNAGKLLIGVWVKSGCNASGDGPGYGEFFPLHEVNRHAMMVWEDLIVNSDYDYNDLVASLHATEIRNMSNELCQIDLVVKALARGAGYTSDWQFNMDAAFPGANVYAIVDQYYHTGERHGAQRIWTSSDGASVPVFAPTKDALPVPPDHSFATNVVVNTTYIEGDYATVKIVLDPPLPQGTYTPAPYEPELRVQPHYGSVYVIGLWREKGDPVDSNGRPLGFIVPDTFAWPLESKKIWYCYPTFNEWVQWINDGIAEEPYPMWSETDPVQYFFDRSLFK